MFYEKLTILCAEHDITPTGLLKKLKLSTGSLAKWRNGARVTFDTVDMIAHYFGVSLDYFSER